MSDERGFIMLVTFMLMLVLTIVVGTLLYIATYETRDLGAQIDDYKLLNLADAGVERAHRAIRDDYLTTTQTGTADLRGEDTDLSVSITNPDNMRYIDSATATINDNADEAILRTFDSNYTQTRIISVVLRGRAARGTGSGPNQVNPTIQVSYTTNGATYTTMITQELTSPSLTDLTPADITGTLTWSTIMSSNFRLRAMRTGTGNLRNIDLDSLYLRVTYEIDTNTESWYTGGYAAFPITLGDGTIQSATITDESGKVHLNYASQDLLSNLFSEAGITSPAPATLAANVVSYRGAGLTNPFDTVEELMQVSGMTTANYNLVDDFVTVYSFVNTNVFRPTGPRAPININTAPRQVLEAIFDPLSLGAADPASLATDIIDRRATTPFTCFYSSDSSVTSDFYDFVISRPYLDPGGNPDERDNVLDNADASSLIPVSGSATFPAVTTEFSYATNTFRIESLADISGRRFRVRTILGDDGSHTFTTFVGDTTSIGYRKENFE